MHSLILRSARNRLIQDIFLLSVAWIAIAALVNPLGDFPLNDDWAYAYTVKELLEHGRYVLSSWGIPTLLTQVLWGTLFCLFTGFSFTALRFSTLTLGLIGMSTFYMTLREVGVKRGRAWIGTLMLTLNPLYICLSYSFMTDIPFLCCWLLSLYFFLRFYNTSRFSKLVYATICACAAALIRQFGILLPLAFGLAYLRKNGFNKQSLLYAALPSVVTASVLGLYYIFLTLSGDSQVISDVMPLTSMLQTMAMYNLTLINLFMRDIGFFAFSLLYLGIFLLPFLLLKVMDIYKISPQATLLRFILLSVFFAFITLSLSQGLHITLLPNIIYNFGLGPIIVPPTGCNTYSLDPYLPKLIRWFFSIISAVFAGLFCAWLYKAKKELTNTRSFLHFLALYFCLIYALALLVHITSGVALFDRYLLPFLALFILVLGSSSQATFKDSKICTCILCVWFILMGTFSIAGTHDYLSANRTFWKATTSLQKINATPEQIEGGFEFDSWYLYNKLHPKTRPIIDNKNCHFDYTNYTKLYAVAFFAVRNYDVCEKLSYSRWLDMDKQPVYLLRRNSSFPCP